MQKKSKLEAAADGLYRRSMNFKFLEIDEMNFKYGSVGGAPGNRCFYPELGLHKAVPLRYAALGSRLREAFGGRENPTKL